MANDSEIVLAGNDLVITVKLQTVSFFARAMLWFNGLSLHILSPTLDGCFVIAISLEFSLTPFLSIKEATLFDNCQPDFQPDVVRRYFLPVRPRYAAVIAGLGDQTRFNEFCMYH